MLRRVLLLLAGSARVKELITRMPVSSGIVNRYVPGESVAAAVASSAELISSGCVVTIDYLGEDTLDQAQAEATVTAYSELLQELSQQGLANRAEVSVKLSAIGQALPEVGQQLCLENARRICLLARRVGARVTIDMEDHTTTDRTLAVVHELRKDFPDTGAVLQAYLRRTESDCRALAHEGSRIRLCKGAYNEPESVAFQDRLEIDRSFVRCLQILFSGAGYPMVASHDPRMIAIAESLAARNNRAPGTYEYQMLYGIRPEEQLRLARSGETMRIYLPFGQEWYGYLMRRLAERPSNMAFFLRSLISAK
ncbi:MAG TPA: proline dehydrogenase family protein [Marmoricola sp.]|nr:proline dehydrogenase family protein [Marmoricola sp.]HNJ78039.1 proline dehydrogenase family protein [Marmoricola sp.]